MDKEKCKQNKDIGSKAVALLMPVNCNDLQNSYEFDCKIEEISALYVAFLLLGIFCSHKVVILVKQEFSGILKFSQIVSQYNVLHMKSHKYLPSKKPTMLNLMK